MALREALMTASLSGGEVHIITQSSPPDSYLVYYCAQSFIEEFLAAGIRVSVYTPGMMHAKSVVVDGEWAMIGTANLDNRSMFLGFEQMAICFVSLSLLLIRSHKQGRQFSYRTLGVVSSGQ